MYSFYLIEEIYKQILFADLRSVVRGTVSSFNGRGGLAALSTSQKQSQLTGTHLVQIMSIVNISESLETREDQDNSENRTLKLALTDGHHTVYGIEHHHIPSINPKLSLGTKLTGETATTTATKKNSLFTECGCQDISFGASQEAVIY
eukprot:gene19134-22915_t